MFFLYKFPVIFIFVMAGCAYKIGQSSRVLPGNFKAVSIPIFENKTQETQIEVFFSNALLNEIEKSKVAEVISEDFSEARIVGVIDTIEILPGGRREGGDLPVGTVLASEYRILLSVTIKFLRKFDNKVLWSHKAFGERTYVAPQVTQSVVNTVNPLYNHSARRLTIEILSKQMMSEVVSLMTENF
jgi:hypothetical protein